MHLKLRLPSPARLTSVFVVLLTVAAIALSFGNAGPAYALVGDCTPGSTWGTVNTAFEAQVLTLVNQHRTSMGLGALSTSPTLTNSAHWKSLHMAFYGYMQHDDPAPPVARTASDRLAACGYPIGSVSWGENIAYGYSTPQDVVTAWLNSPEHRANIETPSFRASGIGAVKSATGVMYWTQDFGSLVDSGSPPPSAPTVTLTATPASSTTSTGASFAWTTTNSPTSTSCSLDNAVSSCSSPQSYSGLAVGSHSFVVTVSNSGGSNSATFNWTVTSSTPPPSATYSTLKARHSGQCLDVYGVSLVNGARVAQWTCNGGDNQRWQLQAVGGGYYNLVVKHSGQCLDVYGASQADGASVVQWPCNGGTNQQWQLVATDSGYAKLVAHHSGKCLDVYGASQTPGANAVQWSCNGGSNQQWLTGAG